MDNTFVFPIVRRDMIIPALDSLHRVTPKNYKVIVVNQTRFSAVLADDLGRTADIVINTSKNYGYAQAANLGARLATTEYVTICNDDVLFFWAGWWDGIQKTFERFENALAVNPMSPKEPGWGYGEKGYRIHATMDECFDNPVGTIAKLQTKWGESVVDAFAGFCAVFRRKAWVELGLFDERFFPGGGEDYDMSARAYQAGYRMLSTPESWIWHHWGMSKDESDGFDVALPHARKHWNYLSTAAHETEGLWHPNCDVWGKNCERVQEEVYRAEL